MAGARSGNAGLKTSPIVLFGRLGPEFGSYYFGDLMLDSVPGMAVGIGLHGHVAFRGDPVYRVVWFVSHIE